MRCISCDEALSDYEATRKHKVTGKYLDLCNSCLSEVLSMAPIPFSGNSELNEVILDKDRDNE